MRTWPPRPGRVAARAERLDPDAGHHGVHPRGPRRQGVPRLDPGRRGDRRRRVQPADPAGRAGVVSGCLGRPRPGGPGDFTIHTAPGLLDGGDPWAEQMPPPQELDADLIAEGHTIPVARVQAMHEGKRRARAGRDSTP